MRPYINAIIYSQSFDHSPGQGLQLLDSAASHVNYKSIIILKGMLINHKKEAAGGPRKSLTVRINSCFITTTPLSNKLSWVRPSTLIHNAPCATDKFHPVAQAITDKRHAGIVHIRHQQVSRSRSGMPSRNLPAPPAVIHRQRPSYTHRQA